MEKEEKLPVWAKKLMDNIDSLHKKMEARKNNEKLETLKAAATSIGIPMKLVDKYQIGENFDQETALAELQNEWNDLKEFATTGKITDKDEVEQIEKDARTASIRKAMQDEADKLINGGQEGTAGSSKSELEEYASKLVNE